MDVKQLNSYGLGTDPERGMQHLVKTMKDGIAQGEEILVNTSNAEMSHIEMFIHILTKELGGIEMTKVKFVDYKKAIW